MKLFKLLLIFIMFSYFAYASIFPSLTEASAGKIEIIGSSTDSGQTESRDVKIRLSYEGSPQVEKKVTQPDVDSLPPLLLENQQFQIDTQICQEKSNDPSDCNSTEPCVYLSSKKTCVNKYATDSASLGTNQKNIQSQANFPSKVEPKFVRAANSVADLNQSVDIIFEKSGMEISWKLPKGNGVKTVYAQYNVNGIWEEPVSTSITLKEPNVASSLFSRIWQFIKGVFKLR